MKYYKVKKSMLKWKEIPQIEYKWKLPILINTEFEVILGNSLKDSLQDDIIVVAIDNNQREVLYQALYEIETKIAEENSQKRFDAIASDFTRFFQQTRKQHVEYEELFPMKEERLITPELYITPPPYNFEKHRHNNELYNDGCVLMEEFLEKVEGKEPEIEIDLEIMKELL